MPGLSPRSHARDPNLAAKPGQASNADQGYLMMGKAASGSRSSWAVQAWPDQATGAALPNGSARRKSATQISFHRPRHWSLQLPRSHKRSHALNTCGYIGSSPDTLIDALVIASECLNGGVIQPPRGQRDGVSIRSILSVGI